MSSSEVDLPPVPLTLEGSFVLHQMFKIRWSRWKALAAEERGLFSSDASALLAKMEQSGEGQSALFSLLGHKGDLLVLHFRSTLEELNRAQVAISNLKWADFLEPGTSYLSVVELGLYEFSVRLYESLKQRGIQEASTEWKQAIEAAVMEQRRASAPRLRPKIPSRPYLCFYPMSKLRGESKNWYQVPIQERQRMMAEHGVIGRRYAGEVTQIISGSIGFDDWEWGVDLFADDPLVFKKLVYEMRFDEASAIYGLFGSFYLGLRFPAARLGELLSGEAPVR